MSADLADRVDEPPVVGGVDLDRHPPHPGAVVALRFGEERQEHPRLGMPVQVGGAALAGLAQVGQVHRDVAQRVMP